MQEIIAIYVGTICFIVFVVHALFRIYWGFTYPPYRLVETIDGNGTRRWAIQHLDAGIYCCDRNDHDFSIKTYETKEKAEEYLKLRTTEYNRKIIKIVVPNQKRMIEEPDDWAEFKKWEKEVDNKRKKIHGLS